MLNAIRVIPFYTCHNFIIIFGLQYGENDSQTEMKKEGGHDECKQKPASYMYGLSGISSCTFLYTFRLSWVLVYVYCKGVYSFCDNVCNSLKILLNKESLNIDKQYS